MGLDGRGQQVVMVPLNTTAKGEGVAPGTCGQYKDGDAALQLCVRDVVGAALQRDERWREGGYDMRNT
jgi:hypothetical protein